MIISVLGIFGNTYEASVMTSDLKSNLFVDRKIGN